MPGKPAGAVSAAIVQQLGLGNPPRRMAVSSELPNFSTSEPAASGRPSRRASVALETRVVGIPSEALEEGVHDLERDRSPSATDVIPEARLLPLSLELFAR